MTRINCIDPELLSDKHLIAEYRELPRIFNLIRKAQERNDTKTLSTYRLGEGHVRFFYDKALYLQRRQQSLIDECLNRKFNIQYTDTSSLLDGIDPSRLNDWIPTAGDITINISRINERGGLRNEVDN